VRWSSTWLGATILDDSALHVVAVRRRQVVLTYVAVLDGVPDPASRQLLEHGIARSGDPTSPSPPEVCPDAVATHAARHLAWLRGTDEVVGAALTGVPWVWDALDRFEPAPAGAAPLL
jgi:hypothetical protein